MQEIYYLIEYGNFEYNFKTFHGSKNERSLDKLLGHFTTIGQLYEMNIIKKEDIDILKYEFNVIYSDIHVQNYLKHLDQWFKDRKIGHVKFEPFRKFAASLV
jgi:protein tyrosine/serine phosphatase